MSEFYGMWITSHIKTAKKKKNAKKKKSIGHGVLLCSSGSSCPVTQAITTLFTHALTLSWLTRSTKGPGVGGEVAESPLQKSQGILWLDKMWGPVKREDWEESLQMVSSEWKGGGGQCSSRHHTPSQILKWQTWGVCSMRWGPGWGSSLLEAHCRAWARSSALSSGITTNKANQNKEKTQSSILVHPGLQLKK